MPPHVILLDGSAFSSISSISSISSSFLFYIVDAIMSQLFSLPTPERAFYCNLIHTIPWAAGPGRGALARAPIFHTQFSGRNVYIYYTITTHSRLV